jgi:hypothetical protein
MGQKGQPIRYTISLSTNLRHRTIMNEGSMIGDNPKIVTQIRSRVRDNLVHSVCHRGTINFEIDVVEAAVYGQKHGKK